MNKKEIDREHANAVMEKYFDTDIQDAESALEVLLDNGVEYAIAVGIAQDMFPPEEGNHR